MIKFKKCKHLKILYALKIIKNYGERLNILIILKFNLSKFFIRIEIVKNIYKPNKTNSNKFFL